MSKRFIDTELFSDEWIQELSPNAKLLFIYYLCNCDHAGILKMNIKLIQFQTGIKSIETLIKELGNSLVRVKEGLYFMPKFIKFQYPGFPKSGVKQQDGAIKILESYNLLERLNELLSNSSVSVIKELPNSYDNDNVNVSDSVLHAMQIFSKTLPNISKLKNQLTHDECDRLISQYDKQLIHDVLLNMENHKGLTQKYESVNLTLRNWIKSELKLRAKETALKNNGLV